MAERGTARNLSATVVCVPVERRAERTAIVRTMRARPGLMSQGPRVDAALARAPSVRAAFLSALSPCLASGRDRR